jgi:cyanophycinase
LLNNGIRSTLSTLAQEDMANATVSRKVTVLLALFISLQLMAADYDHSPTIGPAKGWLIIQGGGLITNEVKERFIALAGGPNANFVVIPSAESDGPIDLVQVRRDFIRGFGVRNVVVLHTRDRVRANSEGFIDPIRHASAVWIKGGRQYRLADAYLGTAVEREIKALLARGGVVGGGSAGASIQASFLVRGAPSGNNTIMVSPGHTTGFGLLPDSAIDQHVDARGRERDLDPVIASHPELLGIGIDQSAAIVVHGDKFQVMGGQVAIHDSFLHDGAHYYFLPSGQVFNLRTRTVEQSNSAPVTTSAAMRPNADQDKYPLLLTVTAARRLNSGYGTTTSGAGVLTSTLDSTQPAQNIVIECDTGVFSRAGANKYPARLEKPHRLKIAAREIGSDKVHESTCKF